MSAYSAVDNLLKIFMNGNPNWSGPTINKYDHNAVRKALEDTVNSIVSVAVDKAVKEITADIALDRVLETLEIISDSEWKSTETEAERRRGLRHYCRDIVFYNPPQNDRYVSVDFIKKHVVRWLENDNCPGFTGVTFKQVSGANWMFYTTYDSGD